MKKEKQAGVVKKTDKKTKLAKQIKSLKKTRAAFAVLAVSIPIFAGGAAAFTFSNNDAILNKYEYGQANVQYIEEQKEQAWNDYKEGKINQYQLQQVFHKTYNAKGVSVFGDLDRDQFVRENATEGEAKKFHAYGMVGNISVATGAGALVACSVIAAASNASSKRKKKKAEKLENAEKVEKLDKQYSDSEEVVEEAFAEMEAEYVGINENLGNINDSLVEDDSVGDEEEVEETREGLEDEVEA